jgi:hypothetical protein
MDFPVGWLKTCRKYYWNKIAESIVQLKDVPLLIPVPKSDP